MLDLVPRQFLPPALFLGFLILGILVYWLAGSAIIIKVSGGRLESARKASRLLVFPVSVAIVSLSTLAATTLTRPDQPQVAAFAILAVVTGLSAALGILGLILEARSGRLRLPSFLTDDTPIDIKPGLPWMARPPENPAKPRVDPEKSLADPAKPPASRTISPPNKETLR